MTEGKRIRTKLGWRSLTALGMVMSLLAGIVITEGAKAQSLDQRRSVDSLTKYATDLTAAAEQGRFNAIDERSDETNRAIQILAGDRKNNPVVITDSQAVRDLVAIGVARRIAQGDVPETLAGKRLFKLNLDTLFHDSKNAPQLLANLSAILSDVAQSDARIILLIDPIQSLLGPAGAFDGAASSLLRDAIKAGDVQCFGASTDVAFQQNVASQEALAPLFATVEMAEASSSTDQTDETANSKQPANTEDFVGDNVSPDLRELIDSPNAPARVNAILQVNDANSSALRETLSRLGAHIQTQLPRFGTLSVDIPTKSIEKLVETGNANYLSLDRPISGLG